MYRVTIEVEIEDRAFAGDPEFTIGVAEKLRGALVTTAELLDVGLESVIVSSYVKEVD